MILILQHKFEAINQSKDIQVTNLQARYITFCTIWYKNVIFLYAKVAIKWWCYCSSQGLHQLTTHCCSSITKHPSCKIRVANSRTHHSPSNHIWADLHTLAHGHITSRLLNLVLILKVSIWWKEYELFQSAAKLLKL